MFQVKLMYKLIKWTYTHKKTCQSTAAIWIKYFVGRRGAAARLLLIKRMLVRTGTLRVSYEPLLDCYWLYSYFIWVIFIGTRLVPLGALDLSINVSPVRLCQLALVRSLSRTLGNHQSELCYQSKNLLILFHNMRMNLNIVKFMWTIDEFIS